MAMMIDRRIPRTILAALLAAFVALPAGAQNSTIRGLIHDTSPAPTDAYLVSKLGISRDQYQLAVDLLGPAFQSFTLALPAQFSCTPSPATAAAGVAAITCTWTATVVPLANLSDFVASGGSHARGIVPDPGGSAGVTRYLREDATWAVPPAPVDATSSIKGILELANDLCGSATAPQVCATHLSAALPTNQGGSGTVSTLAGVMRGGSPMTAAEMSGDCTTSGSNAITCTKTNGVVFAPAATLDPNTVPHGGTGDTTLTAHGPLLGEGTGAVAAASAGIAGQRFVSNGSSADGSYQSPVLTSQTANYSIPQTESYTECNAAGGAFTETLPDAAAAGATGTAHLIKKTDSSTNLCSVATTSAQTVDGATPAALAYQGAFLAVVSNGANWDVVGTASGPGHYDPETEPTSCFTGSSVCETWPGNVARQSWTWQNQGTATETLEMEGATLAGCTSCNFQVRGLGAPSSGTVDFTVTAQVDLSNLGNGCGIGVLTGTLASPTKLYFGYFTSSGAPAWQTATSYAAAGLANISVPSGSIGVDANTLSGCVQLRYIASTGVLTFAFSNETCKIFNVVATTTTLLSAPPSFFYFVRDNTTCHLNWVRARTESSVIKNWAGK